MEERREKRKRFCADRILFWIGMGLLFICLAAGLFLKYRYRLAKPVFLESYRICPVTSFEDGERGGWHSGLELGYITGEQDKKTVQYLEFPELGICRETNRACAGFVVLGEDVTPVGPYAIHVMSGRVECTGREIPEEPVAVTKGIVTYSDGSQEGVTLGEILLAPEGDIKQYTGETYFGSSSEGGSVMEVEIEEAGTLTLQKIEAPEGEAARLLINGVSAADFLSLSVEKGDVVHIKGSFDRKKAGLMDPILYGDSGLSALFYFTPKEKLSGGGSVVFGAKQPADFSGTRYINLWKYLRERGAF